MLRSLWNGFEWHDILIKNKNEKKNNKLYKNTFLDHISDHDCALQGFFFIWIYTRVPNYCQKGDTTDCATEQWNQIKRTGASNFLFFFSFCEE